MQSANTDELMMHYKSVRTVFDITRSAVLTRPLKHAEKLIIPHGIDDYVYYNTFIKGTTKFQNTGIHKRKMGLVLRNNELTNSNEEPQNQLWVIILEVPS